MKLFRILRCYDWFFTGVVVVCYSGLKLIWIYGLIVPSAPTNDYFKVETSSGDEDYKDASKSIREDAKIKANEIYNKKDANRDVLYAKKFLSVLNMHRQVMYLHMHLMVQCLLTILYLVVVNNE